MIKSAIVTKGNDRRSELSSPTGNTIAGEPPDFVATAGIAREQADYRYDAFAVTRGFAAGTPDSTSSRRLAIQPSTLHGPPP